jgi:hypothetical protein
LVDERDELGELGIGVRSMLFFGQRLAVDPARALVLQPPAQPEALVPGPPSCLHSLRLGAVRIVCEKHLEWPAASERKLPRVEPPVPIADEFLPACCG